MSKRVVLFLVEGASEETAFGSIMQKAFVSDSVRFDILQGDITARRDVNEGNVLKRLNEVIKNYLLQYRYRASDIKRIIHLVDMDGVFVGQDAVKPYREAGVRYTEECIFTANVEGIFERNARKSKVLHKLSGTFVVNRMPYKVYYNSCNLEHVLIGELREFSNDEKQEIAIAFSDRYDEQFEEFKKFLEQFLPDKDFKGSWQFIKKERNSLNRYSNMGLIVEE